jgi:integrase
MRGDGRLYTRQGSSLIWCAYYLRGKQYRESTGETDEKKALKFLKNKLKEVHADEVGARAFVGPQQRRITVNELLDSLETDYRLESKDSAQFKSHLKPLRAYFGDRRAVSVTSDAIDAFIEDRIQKEYKPATINRSTQLLGQAFKLALQKQKLSASPYIRHLSEKDNVRQGFFGVLEFEAVKSNLPDYLKDYCYFAFLTGWRKSEVASLRWSDVEGDLLQLRGVNSKNGEGRSVTLEGELAELIERRRKARAVKTKSGVILVDLVFHHNGGAIVDLRKAWASACKLSGLPGRLFHDLRRSGVRNMTRAGVPQTVAMKISGHKTDSMFRRYNITSEADLRDAVKRTQAYLLATAAEETKRQPVAMVQ